MIFVISLFCVQEVPRCFPGGPRTWGGPQLQNGGLRALEEAWDLLEAFFCQVWSFSASLGGSWSIDLRSWNSQEVKGSPELQNGGLEEAWDDFLLGAFFCQVLSFSVFLGRLWGSRFLGFWRLEAGRWR